MLMLLFLVPRFFFFFFFFLSAFFFFFPPSSTSSSSSYTYNNRTECQTVTSTNCFFIEQSIKRSYFYKNIENEYELSAS